MSNNGSASPAIVIRGVGKEYAQRNRKSGSNVVLQDVDLEIRTGEFVSLVGTSGCGKTTLLRMIGGLTAYEPGEIYVEGKLVRSIPRRIGFVFQDSALMPWQTVWENVRVGLNESRRQFSRDEIKSKVDAALELVGLGAYANYLPRHISGGMQQRAGLARALVGQPDILLMDEPFGALDAFTRMRLQEELASIVARTSATTVFVTHDVDEAVFLSDRVAVMSANPGTITALIDIDIPRPRLQRTEMLGNYHVAQLRDHVLSLVLNGGGTAGERAARRDEPEPTWSRN
ncbi:MAG TPA: ABC transporter ATP-binding protein [Jatrophihabitans sp.]|nr:ABC transporter ATP-binding protein [Jatrophihabitans sp.]